MWKKASIIIPTFNNLDTCLKPCLKSIFDYTDMSNIEVIIVANGCTDNTVEYCTQQQRIYNMTESIKIIEDSKPLGYTRATNIGILNSVGEYIVFLNNDTVLLPQKRNLWLDMLIDPLKDSSVGITGPLILNSQSTGHPFVVFFCAATKRSLINQIGILDESYSPGGGDDIDFCIRAQNKSYKLVSVPNSNLKLEAQQNVGGFPIYHKAEATMHNIPDWNNILNNNFRKVFEKHGHMS
jgi:O-antigen biosynthesis protein